MPKFETRQARENYLAAAKSSVRQSFQERCRHYATTQQLGLTLNFAKKYDQQEITNQKFILYRKDKDKDRERDMSRSWNGTAWNWQTQSDASKSNLFNQNALAREFQLWSKPLKGKVRLPAIDYQPTKVETFWTLGIKDLEVDRHKISTLPLLLLTQ